MILTVTIDYQGQTSPDTATVAVSGLVSATDPMPAIASPGNVVSTFQVTDQARTGPGRPTKRFVHLVVTAPSGVSFNSATFSQVVWGLSDQAGLAWDSTAATLGHNHIYATLRPNSDERRRPVLPAGARRGAGRRVDLADDAAARGVAERRQRLRHAVRRRGLELERA